MHETKLTYSLQQRIDAACDAFEAQWRTGAPPDINEHLEPFDGAERATLLNELIILDLANRWRTDRTRQESTLRSDADVLPERPMLDDYVQHFQDLPPTNQLPVELIAEEYRVRQRWGDRPGLDAFLEKFPQRRELEPILAEIERALPMSRDAAGSGVPIATSLTADQRFKVVRLHAEGGLGQVSIAFDRELNREVALKEIQERFADDAANRSRFVAEAEITGRLEHPGIVPVYAFGRDLSGRPYYAMRFIRGRSLISAIDDYFHSATSSNHLNGGSLAFQRMLRRFVDVCNAIEYAHSRGIVHRDIKPANVMLGDFGETLVVDWGLAKSYAAGKDATDPDETATVIRPRSGAATLQGSIVGTPAYMSPEQSSGERNLTPASDVYSLGATLYHILTGQAPFANACIRELISRVESGRFPRPRDVRPHIAKPLEAISLKAMSLVPQDRYISANELADDVERWLADEPVTAYREPLTATMWRWMRKHRSIAISTAVIVAVALIAATSVLMITRHKNRQLQEVNRDLDYANADERRARLKADESREETEKVLYAARMHLAMREWNDGRVGEVRNLLNQQRPENRGCVDHRGFEWYYLDRLTHAELVSLDSPGGSVENVAVSPDGHRLVSVVNFNGRPPEIRIWDAATGRLLRSLRGHRWQIQSVAFDHSGTQIVSAGGKPGQRGELKVWDIKSGKLRYDLSGHSDLLRSARFSPDGQLIASATQDNTVKLYDTTSRRELKTLQGHKHVVHSVDFSPDGRMLASSSADTEVRIWNVQTWNLMAILQHQKAVYRVAFDPTGKWIASAEGTRLGRVSLWSAPRVPTRNIDGQKAPVPTKSTGAPITRVNPHWYWRGQGRGFNDIAFSRDGLKFAASDGRIVTVWDFPRLDAPIEIRGHEKTVHCCMLSPNGRLLATGSADGAVKLWEIDTEQEFLSLRGHDDWGYVVSAAFSSDGRLLATGARPTDNKPGKLIVWDTTIERKRFQLFDSKDAKAKSTVWAVAFSPNGKRLAAARGFENGSSEIQVWNVVTGQSIWRSTRPGRSVRSVAFHRNGALLVSGEKNQEGLGEIVVWDSQTGQKLRGWIAHGDLVNCVAFSPDGQTIASCGGSRSSELSIRLWNADTGKQIWKTDTRARQIVFDSMGTRIVAAGNFDRKIHLYDAKTGREMAALSGHAQRTTSVAISPDGRRIASAAGSVVKLWSVESGHEVFRFESSGQRFEALAFDPSGQRLAGTGYRGMVRIWDARLTNRK